ncbi:PspA/IM30 family protein [Actinokineospora sp. G85]|uniref:PspA/IM30 family protein n=1 Tax=Actinokineospora sp. G85 TaxID=3406626 RepID=UPI003C715BE1
MAPFDVKAYETDVVKPLRRWSGRDLPDDLVTRYAVDLSMSDVELAARLAEVRSHWNKGANSPGKAAAIRSIYKAFLAADTELKAENSADMNDIQWWRSRAKARAGTQQVHVEALAKNLAVNFGWLGLIAAGQLEATMRVMATSLAPEEVDQALAAARVRREVPLELPRSSGLQDTVYRTLRSRLVDARLGSVVELLHGEVAGFRLLHGFSAPGRPGARLDAAAVEEAVQQANRRSGNQAEREVLGILGTAVRKGGDLRDLTVHHLLEEVRDGHSSGAPPSTLLALLTRTGWDQQECALALFSVLNEGVSARPGGLTRVTELLGEGKLVEARQLLGSITAAEDATAARELVDRQSAQVEELRRAAATALREGDESTARDKLRQAATLAADDEGLRDELRRIPLSPALEATAATAGLGLRVSWRAAADHPEDAVYRVVRQVGRAPGDPDDGTTVREGPGGTAVTDDRAPAAVLIGYSVFASVEGGAWSRRTECQAEILPTVQDVRLVLEDGVVTGTWRTHPDAVTVHVARGEGRATAVVAVAGGTSLREEVEGDDHAYTFTVSYRRPNGATVRSAALRVRALGRSSAEAVEDLEVEPVAVSGSTQVSLSWTKPAGGEVAVRRSTAPPPWRAGVVVAASELAAFGEEVRGEHRDHGVKRILIADVPAGIFHYLPVTQGPAGAVCGQAVAVGVASQVTGLRARLLGGEYVLSWAWPDQVAAAEVSWPRGSRRVSRQQYQSEGGFRLPNGPGVTSVSVRGLISAGRVEQRSAATTLELDAPVVPVHYSVAVSRKLRGVQVRVSVRTDQAVGKRTVLVTGTESRVMPLNADQSHHRSEHVCDLTGQEPVELVIEFPKLRKPFWIRCFLPEGEDRVRLVDPPANQLKVS